MVEIVNIFSKKFVLPIYKSVEVWYNIRCKIEILCLRESAAHGIF